LPGLEPPLRETSITAGAGTLLATPGTRAGPALMPDAGSGRGGLVVNERAAAGGNGGHGMPGRLDSAIGSPTRGGTGATTGVGEVGMLSVRPGTGGVGEGLATFARPLGGYQVTPPYPESARRLGIQGVAQLRFEVLPTGRVGSVLVDRSAGHPDLDRAAVDAVRQWRFEPARRGSEPVAVWVTLPVRFELR
jgi:TonB family protein